MECRGREGRLGVVILCLVLGGREVALWALSRWVLYHANALRKLPLPADQLM